MHADGLLQDPDFRLRRLTARILGCLLSRPWQVVRQQQPLQKHAPAAPGDRCARSRVCAGPPLRPV